MKRLIGFLVTAMLVLAACGGSDTTNPATFGDEAQAPANDKFLKAESISRVSFNKQATNVAATLEKAEPRPCGEIDNTVWFRYTPRSDINLKAKASATFDTTVAVYSGTSMTALTEVGCATTGTTTELGFAGIAGETYNIQVGSLGTAEGNISFSLDNANQAQLLIGDPGPLLPGWTEKVLVEEHTVTVPPIGPIDLDLLTIDGKPRAADPKMYEITITAAGQPIQTIAMNSRGFLTEPIHLELVQIAKEETRATVSLSYRFDPRQTSCELEIGGTCAVRLPVDPTNVNWTTTNGPQAELIVKADVVVGKTDINGASPDVQPPSPLWVRIPLLGQVSALIP